MRVFLLLSVLALIFVSLAAAGEIHEAAKNGDLARLRELLNKDPGLLYVQDEVGKTPLHWAAGRHQSEAMKVLLDEYKVDVNVRNKNDGTPLHVAASQANPEGARILIAHGADVNARTKNLSTPLHFAAFKGQKPGHIEAAQVLIDAGADVNAQTDTGATPLSYAVFRGNREIISLLKARGAKASTSRGSRRGRGAGNPYLQGGMGSGGGAGMIDE